MLPSADLLAKFHWNCIALFSLLDNAGCCGFYKTQVIISHSTWKLINVYIFGRKHHHCGKCPIIVGDTFTASLEIGVFLLKTLIHHPGVNFSHHLLHPNSKSNMGSQINYCGLVKLTLPIKTSALQAEVNHF